MTIDSKQALRARLRAARDAFVADKPGTIIVPDAFRARLDRGLTVTSYVPIGSEADPSPFARAAVATRRRRTTKYINRAFRRQRRRHASRQTAIVDAARAR